MAGVTVAVIDPHDALRARAIPAGIPITLRPVVRSYCRIGRGRVVATIAIALAIVAIFVTIQFGAMAIITIFVTNQSGAIGPMVFFPSTLVVPTVVVPDLQESSARDWR